MSLSERQKQILKAVISDYVLTAEPVGSKNLIKRYDLSISSATVRNEMMALEELGYLEKPHTSAGRIPSDKGYRAYVDELLTLSPLPEATQQQIEERFADKVQEVAQLIKSSVDLLAEQTSYPTLALTPRYANTSLEQIKILMIEPGKALIVVVLSPGVVKDRMVRIPPEVDPANLAQLAQSIELGLSGKKLNDITMITVSLAAGNSGIPEPLLNQILFEAYVSIKQAENVDVYLQGTHRLLTQPEFSDAQKAHRVLDQMNHHALIAGYMNELYEEPTYTVRIGQEITLDGFEDCSFITTTYRLGDNIKGQIGVVGPRRMPYNKIISQVNFINQKLNEAIRRYAVHEDESKPGLPSGLADE